MESGYPPTLSTEPVTYLELPESPILTMPVVNLMFKAFATLALNRMLAFRELKIQTLESHPLRPC